MGGVRLGRTLGSPICVLVSNADHVNWQDIMSPYAPAGAEGSLPVGVETVPRPGHADLAGMMKFGFADIRDVLERASARETVARVAAGAVCRRLLEDLGVKVRGRVVSIGTVTVPGNDDFVDPDAIDWDAVESSPVACADESSAAAMCAAIDRARSEGESVGGVFEVWCWGLCPGLGGYATIRDRLDGRLMGALGSIPAVKGVEVGSAFENAGKRGSEVHDSILVEGTGGDRLVVRGSNRAGGIEGGMSTGQPIVLRAAMKPIPTLTTPLSSVDVANLEARPAHVERSDVAAVPAARVVGEAMAAYVLADAYVEKFGGDSMVDLTSAVSSYCARLEERGLWRRS
jgi:chorismate synthase